MKTNGNRQKETVDREHSENNEERKGKDNLSPDDRDAKRGTTTDLLKSLLTLNEQKLDKLTSCISLHQCCALVHNANNQLVFTISRCAPTTLVTN